MEQWWLITTVTKVHFYQVEWIWFEIKWFEIEFFSCRFLLTEAILGFSSIRTWSWLFLTVRYELQIHTFYWLWLVLTRLIGHWCCWPPQGPRTLSLLVENCGRVHRGRDLDKQHKGDQQKSLQFITNLPAFSENESVLICALAGLVGDIALNDVPLHEFSIYSLDMKPSFIDRFVNVVKFNIPHNTFFNNVTETAFSLQPLSGILEKSPWKSYFSWIFHGEAVCIWLS